VGTHGTYSLGGRKDHRHLQVRIVSLTRGQGGIPPKVDVVATAGEQLRDTAGHIALARLGRKVSLFDKEDDWLDKGRVGGGGQSAQQGDGLENGVLIQDAGEDELGERMHGQDEEERQKKSGRERVSVEQDSGIVVSPFCRCGGVNRSEE